MTQFKICPKCEGRTGFDDTTYDRTGTWVNCSECYATGLELPPNFVRDAVRTALLKLETPKTKRPHNCRNEQQARGEVYPRSGCDYCRNGGLLGCPFDRVTA